MGEFKLLYPKTTELKQSVLYKLTQWPTTATPLGLQQHRQREAVSQHWWETGSLISSFCNEKCNTERESSLRSSKLHAKTVTWQSRRNKLGERRWAGHRKHTQKAHTCSLVLLQGQRVCGCVHTSEQDKYAQTNLKATCKPKPTLLPCSRQQLPWGTDGSEDTGKHRDHGHSDEQAI